MKAALADLYDRVDSIPGAGNIYGQTTDSDWQHVTRVEPPPNATTGQVSDIFVQRLPAKFWRLTSGPIEITTGSCREAASFIGRVATDLALGTLSIRWREGAFDVEGGKDVVAEYHRLMAENMVLIRWLQ